MTGHEGILEKLFNTIHFGFAYMDKNFNFIRVNRKYAEYENRDTDFFVGKNYFSLYPNPENKKVFSSVAKTGISHAEYAREFVHPDGRMTYLDWTLYPIKNPINSVEGLVLCLLDATEKTQIERELKITCDNLTALIENLPGCVFIKDHKSRLVWINSYAEKNYNWNKKNLIGKSDFDIWPEQADEFRKEDLRIIKTGNKIENVNEFIYKGKRKIHHTYKFPICVEGMPPMVGGFGYDVTDLVEELERKDLLLARAADESQKELLRRKKSEEALRQIGKRLAQTERIAHLGSWKFDLRKNRFSFSGEMRTIFGLSPETKFLTFKQLLKKIHPLDRKRFLSSCLESVKSLSPINTQTGIIISGEEKFLQLAGKMKLDSMGEPIWISGTATNITDLKKTRDALLAEHLELNKSLREKILLADIASILNSSIPFDRTQKSILEKIHGTLNIDHLNLWTLTDTNELKWAEGCNPPDLEIGDKIIDKEATVSLLEALSEIQEEYISELEESSIYMP